MAKGRSDRTSVGALILTGVAIRGAGRHGALGNLDGLFERIYPGEHPLVDVGDGQTTPCQL